MQAGHGYTVIFHITYRLSDGRIIDSTRGREPLTVKIGDDEIIVPELEQVLTGMKPGESATITIPAARVAHLYGDEILSKIGRQDFFVDVQLVSVFSPRESAALDRVRNGLICRQQGNMNGAIAFLRDAVKMSPELPAPYYVLGSMLQNQGHIEEAINCYRKILSMHPDHAETHNILGSAYQQKGELDAAVVCYRDSIRCDGNSFMAYNNLGTALRLLGNLDESAASYREALRIKPDFTGAMNNLGTVLRDQGKIDDAISWYRRAIQLDPDFPDAHWNLAFALLLSGNYEEGWEEYEWVWKLKKPVHGFLQPLWYGDDIRGKRILLYAEQGFGDVIQFVRYAPMVADRGAEVILGCQKELKSLLKSLRGVSAVVAFGEPLPQFDFQCSLPSLPRIFHTTPRNIPSLFPYLQADPRAIAKWGDRMRVDSLALNVGMAWAGSPGHLNDGNRSCPLHVFEAIACVQGLKLFSLQKEINERWTSIPLTDLNITDYTEDIEDFSDTAGIIMNLDLVITVDTAVAHLAGALGKPVWMLLPFAPDWRWMLERDDSPWYPTMRLFRQPAPGDWASVITEVRDALERMMPAKAFLI